MLDDAVVSTNSLLNLAARNNLNFCCDLLTTLNDLVGLRELYDYRDERVFFDL